MAWLLQTASFLSFRKLTLHFLVLQDPVQVSISFSDAGFDTLYAVISRALARYYWTAALWFAAFKTCFHLPSLTFAVLAVSVRARVRPRNSFTSPLTERFATRCLISSHSHKIPFLCDSVNDQPSPSPMLQPTLRPTLLARLDSHIR